MINTDARVLIYDIEVSPERVWAYPGKRINEAIKLETISDQFTLSVAYCWLDEYQKKGKKAVQYIDLSSFPEYKKNMEDDRALSLAIWHLFDKADVLVGHYSINFDTPKMVARFMYHDLGMPSSFEQIDTKRMYSKVGLPSKKLDEIARYFDMDRKEGSHSDYWLRCIGGDEKAWKLMKNYNIQDVAMTADIMLKVFPYYAPPVSLAKYNSAGKLLSPCGSENYQSRGVSATNKGFRKRYQCQVTAGWFPGTKYFKTREEALAAPKGD